MGNTFNKSYFGEELVRVWASAGGKLLSQTMATETLTHIPVESVQYQVQACTVYHRGRAWRTFLPKRPLKPLWQLHANAYLDKKKLKQLRLIKY